ncbi:FUN14 domain-containing protein [Thermococcus sp.]|uniref:FUN14 domain-containing protein n=1 Tax=Thermococcus sp. TaxID=35749 RepID=UPI0026332068|nr:FUN14 domain-containing protein [Thermococcus sp.]
MEFNTGTMFSDMGVGALVGFITGYALKKLLKIAIAIIGAYVLSLFYLQEKGVITINTEKLFNLTGNLSQQVVGLGQKVLGILPGTSAFVAGFYLGFRKG